jgi:soluble lytic murein transglycosylase-like protein
MSSSAARPSALPQRAWRSFCALALAGVLLSYGCNRAEHAEIVQPPPPKPQAPPDLEKLRPTFEAGMDALQRGEGAAAVQRFGSFTFGSRAVEEYRLYFLAQGHQLQRDRNAARMTLAGLWSRHPGMVYSDDVGLNLGSLYGSEADWRHAAETLGALGQSSVAPAVAANANWQAVETHFYDGNLASVAAAAKGIVVGQPKSVQAAEAVAILRSLDNAGKDAPLPLTASERLDRAMALLRDGDPANALRELDALAASSMSADLKSSLQLQRGMALAQLRRFDDSNRQLELLASATYRYAVPALRQGAKNYRVLSNSINPIVNKVIIEKKQVGTVKVRQKGTKKPVLKPKYANVRRTVQLIDLAAKARKEDYDHLSVERLKDLLTLPIDDATRIETLNSLIGIAEAKHQEDYERQLVTMMAAVDPGTEAGLQHFWDEAWAAYLRGDMAATRPVLTFIEKTYRSPNIKRQADYWAARSSERVGDKGGAAAIYASLLQSPYDDLYALEAQARGAKRTVAPPVMQAREDWQHIAEREMPHELRLAYELIALSDPRDARVEIQRNASRNNAHFANALLGELYNSSGLYELAYRYLKLAFPRLATAQQGEVPTYFLKMYYPAKYVEAIRKYSKKNGIDPYVVMALIHQESAFNPKARSVVGAMGLMQLMPATGRELGNRIHGSFSTARLEDPEFNIELGTFYLRHLIDLFGGNVQLAVASYNAGQGNVMKWRRANRRSMDEFLESIPFAETRNYVKRVTILSSGFRRLNGE